MILITGGNGFIGKYICSFLASKGEGVISIDLKEAHPRKDMAYPSIECDIREISALENLFQSYRIDKIIHLASLLNSYSKKNPHLATKVNILGALNLLEMSRKYEVGKIIYGSSISVYGTKSEEVKAKETDTTEASDVYGASKRYVEILGESYSQNYGIKFISLRLATIIGPGAANTTSRWRSDIFELGANRQSNKIAFPGGKEECIPVTHVEELPWMFYSVIKKESPNYGVYNLPAETVTFGQIAGYIRSINDKIEFEYGGLSTVGIPKQIDSSRFVNEFGDHAKPVKEYFIRIEK